MIDRENESMKGTEPTKVRERAEERKFMKDTQLPAKKTIV